MAKESIPRKTVYRLSVYHRCLERLKANEVTTVSSATLASAAGVKPAQLRKDLGYLGQFGTRGLGYGVEELAQRLNEALGTARLQPVILVGVGNLGAALLHYQGFAKEGFEILASFDAHPDRSRAQLTPDAKVLPMEDLEPFLQSTGVKMAILTVPGPAAQEVTNRLVAAGVQAILNFAPVILQVPGHVVVNNVDLALELENLSYFIR
jgi:redox-sensing transcriptional repressor